MRNSNIVKLDQKGRMLLPKHIRQFLNAEEGSELLLLVDNDNNQVKIVPLASEHTMELRFIISDTPGSLAAVADALTESGVNLILSESRTLVRGKIAEWDVILDTSGKKVDLETIKNKLIEDKIIQRMEVLRK